jgi:hypothetical protein
LSDVALDNDAEAKQQATAFADGNLRIIDGRVFWRTHEPHWEVGTDLSGSRPSIRLIEPVGPSNPGIDGAPGHSLQRRVGHRFSVTEYERAISFLDYLTGEREGRPDPRQENNVAALIPEAVREPFHIQSVATNAAFATEHLRENLRKMSTNDVRRWIELSRMVDSGITSDDDALQTIWLMSELKLPMGKRGHLADEVALRWRMSECPPEQQPTLGAWR